ncbi:hypothetical protein KQ297_04045 [Synechococcus sp. CS-205]|jgi:hypothetical protein|nr:hypothetical protein [Synechococcus sp. CS-205]
MAAPSSLTRSQDRPLRVATAFLGMFVLGSLAVQLVVSTSRGSSSDSGVAPVVAHPSTLWQTLGER